jgi:hypothetical protein
MLYFLCSRMSRKFESERPEIYVIWWNDGLLGYNVNVSDDQQPIQKSKWCIFLNKLSIVENTKKINRWKKLKQNVGPWWCVHVCKSYNCRLKQIQGSSQLEVVNSKRFFFLILNSWNSQEYMHEKTMIVNEILFLGEFA